MMYLFDEDKRHTIAYYRFSAEDKQENSIDNQREEVERFAEREDVHIVEAFEDDGVTGLITERPGFQAMFNKYIYNDSGKKIDYLLVYDPSRFSRLQKVPDFWHLIKICEDRGIRLGSVLRGLPKEETTIADTFIMTMDAVMSAEYSKLLSQKVSLGSLNIASQGYSVGGIAPYGYVRVLLDERRNRKQVLLRGMHKEVSNQRVSFEPADDGSAEIVKETFRYFIHEAMFPDEIAANLNSWNVASPSGSRWNTPMVIRLLRNETYTGTRIYNKTNGKLHTKRQPNPSESWVRCLNAHEPLVDYEVYKSAQERLRWTNPRTHNKDLHKIISARQYLLSYIDKLLADFSEDQRYYIKRLLPISFAVSNGESHRSVVFQLPLSSEKGYCVIGCEVDRKSEGAGLKRIVKIKGGKHTYQFADECEKIVNSTELANLIRQTATHVLSQSVPWLEQRTMD